MLTLNANAKINIGLNVIKKRTDGYHEIKSVFCSIDLYDTLTFSHSDTVKITVDGADIPQKDNIVAKAVDELSRLSKRNLPVNIHIQKGIPVGAGLAGGSADCAAALIGLNRMFALRLTLNSLMKIGTGLGSDVPFMLLGGLAIGIGKGDILSPVGCSRIENFEIVIADPRIFISTKDAYDAIDSINITKPSDFTRALEDIGKDDYSHLQELLTNDFETFAFEKYPALKSYKQIFIDSGAIYASMSGTGSCVYGIFKKDTVPEDIQHRFDCAVYITRLSNKGVALP